MLKLKIFENKVLRIVAATNSTLSNAEKAVSWMRFWALQVENFIIRQFILKKIYLSLSSCLLLSLVFAI